MDAVNSSQVDGTVLRDLKRVNAHVASVAYPILEELGMLEESRLKGDPAPLRRA